MGERGRRGACAGRGMEVGRFGGNVEAFFYHITDEVFKDIISKCFLGPTSAEVTNIYIENSDEIFEKKDFLIKKN